MSSDDFEKGLPPLPETLYVADDFEAAMSSSLAYHLSNARVGVEETLSLPPFVSEAIKINQFTHHMGQSSRILLKDDADDSYIDAYGYLHDEPLEIIYAKINFAILNLFRSGTAESLSELFESIRYIEIRIECDDDAQIISNDDIRVHIHPYGEIDCTINDEDTEDKAIFAAPGSESELN